MYTCGRIISIQDGQALIKAPAPPEHILEKQNIKTVGCYYDDGRTLSTEQRGKIMAICNDIGAYQGQDGESAYVECVDGFRLAIELTGGHVEQFSRSPREANVMTMSTASSFINYLIAFCIRNNIPTKRPLREQSEDMGKYLYFCLIHRVCCVCQAPQADIHHTDTIGMGNDRRSISHVGMRAMALCRKHHNEAHSMGQSEFDKRYKVFGIKLGEYEVKKLKLGKMGERHGE